MFRFRISAAFARVSLGLCFLHSKRQAGTPAKRALPFAASGVLLLALTACKHTPTYSGPPNLVLHVVMKKWDIVPNRIVVPQNAHVELVVTTADVEHGLAVPGLAINEPVQPGKPAVIRFLALKPGVYPMHCSILCGRGHDQMIGSIVIVPSPNPPSTAAR